MKRVRAVVVGATGNVGTSVVTALAGDERVESILGVARREPDWTAPRTRWAVAEVERDDLAGLFRGADVVIHVAWLFQPSHRPEVTWRTNVLGSIRVFEAAAAAGVPALVYASSVGAYSPGPGQRPVDESWPTDGWPAASYTREKSYLERVLDIFEGVNPRMRVVRLRTGFIFKRESASQQRRLFAGPLLPGALVRPGLIPVVPGLPGLRLQALHASDAGHAYRLAALADARGAFNVAAEPAVDTAMLARCLGARPVTVPVRPVRALLSLAWQLRLVPASPGLFDAALRLPVMDTTRARTELGWSPRYTAQEAVEEFLGGLRDRAGMPTPPLRAAVPGGRARELGTNIAARP
jgi:UDP-glucose 4-epimerase